MPRDPGLRQEQRGALLDQRGREQVEPVFQLRDAVLVQQPVPMLFQQVGGAQHVTSCQGMLQGFFDQILPGKPAARPAVQRRNVFGTVRGGETLLQEIAKKVMQPKPLPWRVE